MKNTAGPIVPVHWPLLHYEDNSEQPVTLFTEFVQGLGLEWVKISSNTKQETKPETQHFVLSLLQWQVGYKKPNITT